MSVFGVKIWTNGQNRWTNGQKAMTLTLTPNPKAVEFQCRTVNNKICTC